MQKYHRKPRIKTQQKILAQLHRWMEKLERWKAESETKKRDTQRLIELMNFAKTKIGRHENYLKIAMANESSDVGKDTGKDARSTLARALCAGRVDGQLAGNIADNLARTFARSGDRAGYA
jgi:hypothetical protein